MPGPYGVTDAGFNPKLISETLSEIELEEQSVFGAGIVFSPQSPLGQLNGIHADSVTEIWEMAQDVFNSFDIDQATGGRLDSLGKLRRLARLPSQSDSDFRLALNQSDYGTVRTRYIRSRLLTVAGVTNVNVLENDSHVVAPNGLSPNSLAISVVGGSDVDVATAIWSNTTGGIALVGNTEIQIEADGRCTLVNFIRPEEIQFTLELDLSIHLNQCACAPDGTPYIIENLQQQLMSECGLFGGSVVTPAQIEQIAGCYNGVHVEQVRMSRDGTDPLYQNVAFNLYEFPNLTIDDVSINYVPYDGPETTQGTLNFGSAVGVIRDV